MTFSPNNTLEVPLQENVSFSSDYSQFIIQITKYYRDIARKVNDKERAFYPLELEILNSQKFFTTGDPQKYRTVFRKVINTGVLPNAGIKNIAHNIITPTSSWLFVNIYGFARNPTTPRWIPMPNGGPTYQVQLDVTATNVNITTTANLTAFTDSYVVLEYLKN